MQVVVNDKNKKLYFGKDEKNKQCKQCGADCVDCIENYEKCIKCSDGFEPISGICTLKQPEETSSDISSEDQSEQLPIPQINPICFAAYDDENITIYKRCYYCVNEEKTVSVQVISSNYSDFKNESHGGTIYIINCQLDSIYSNFINCVSLNGGGGAIYVKNSKNLVNHVTFINLTFTKCEALFGGAIYIYSSEKTNNVTFTNCTFVSNKAIYKYGEKRFFGGSAVFLTSQQCFVYNCQFIKNIGKGAAFKIHLKFDDNLNSNLLNENIKSELVISSCSFEKNDESKSAIYLINENEGNNVKIQDCDFKGNLKKGEHFIDGSFLGFKHVKGLSVHSCNFGNETNAGINSNLMNEAAPSRKYEYMNKLIMICLICAAVFAGSVLLIYVNFKTRYEQKDFSIEIKE